MKKILLSLLLIASGAFADNDTITNEQLLDHVKKFVKENNRDIHEAGNHYVEIDPIKTLEYSDTGEKIPVEVKVFAKLADPGIGYAALQIFLEDIIRISDEDDPQRKYAIVFAGDKPALEIKLGSKGTPIWI